MTSTQISALAAVTGCVTFVVGAVLMWGIAVALMIAGVFILAAAILLYDPAHRRDPAADADLPDRRL